MLKRTNHMDIGRVPAPECEGKCNTFWKAVRPKTYSFVHQNMGGWATEMETDALMEDVGSDKANQSTGR